MAPARLKRNIDYLSVLNKAKKKQRDAIIQEADKDLILCLCECAYNILGGTVPLEKTDFDKLRKHQNKLRHLVKRPLYHSDKKAILQKGGFLPILLALILGIAGQLLADAIKNDSLE